MEKLLKEQGEQLAKLQEELKKVKGGCLRWAQHEGIYHFSRGQISIKVQDA